MRLDRNFLTAAFIDVAGDELIALTNPATEALIAHVVAASRAGAIEGFHAGWKRSELGGDGGDGGKHGMLEFTRTRLVIMKH